jgi:hypothetical protein
MEVDGQQPPPPVDAPTTAEPTVSLFVFIQNFDS